MPSVAAVVGRGSVAAAIVRRLQRDGMNVIAVGLEGRDGDQPNDVDLTNRGAMKALADRVTRDLGAPSVLVVAPESRASGRFGALAHDQWQRLLMAYLGATTAACAAFVPSMVEARQGCVITVTTSQALADAAGGAYLAAAAGAVLGFTRSFALEVAGHGVRVNGIEVGPSASVEEIADVAGFLVEAGGFYVGQVLSPGLSV